jgi:hypothetical protein
MQTERSKARNTNTNTNLAVHNARNEQQNVARSTFPLLALRLVSNVCCNVTNHVSGRRHLHRPTDPGQLCDD